MSNSLLTVYTASHSASVTGASADVAIDFNNPRVLFAGLWQARRKPWQMTSGGPGSGLYRSSDGGESWSELTGKGLPDEPWGKVGVGVAQTTWGYYFTADFGKPR